MYMYVTFRRSIKAQQISKKFIGEIAPYSRYSETCDERLLNATKKQSFERGGLSLEVYLNISNKTIAIRRQFFFAGWSYQVSCRFHFIT